ncbi:MAG: IS66 family insertion sequence element accessory protein TnpA [Phycisphaerales bacterium]
MDDINSNGSVTKRVRRSAEQWSRLIEAHRDSGQSIKAFCAERGLAAPHFHRWRRRQEETGAVPVPGAGAFVRLRPPEQWDADAMRAVPGAASGVVVRFADGVELCAGDERLSERVALLRPRPRNSEPAGGVRRC